MYKATQLPIDDFVQKLRSAYHRTYGGGLKPDYPDILAWAGGMALENISNSDALYHNVEHTILAISLNVQRYFMSLKKLDIIKNSGIKTQEIYANIISNISGISYILILRIL